ncbi:LpqB family beta-propeller domain-containing protein [Streptomyces sp. RB6PN25]|uniref:LpqB family beta-propeller domain-containing protein n=1 Tax=Streptomyces humicola TaxID=2953240 RepID=A0ABT1Q4R6_9ACTN|nr:LpqB family beta-propeller domain-containing protein [Streptomyces humicola]MCQ4084919.1 LpqB family beta-propeller domain-containing protein [Streptomyces humicola]
MGRQQAVGRAGRHAGRRMRRTRGSRRLLGWACALPACAVLLAGCASMPESGDVTKVADQSRNASDPQVTVFGVKPQKNEQPMEIVRGFLEATTSDEADYSTAKDYLTADAQTQWNPAAGITVLAGGPQLSEVRPQGLDQDPGTTIDLSAAQVAYVDGKRSYTPASGTYRTSFHLVRVDGEWRIDSVPDGLVLSQSDFQRIYQSVNLYFFAQLGQAAGSAPAQGVLVADPVYIRRRIDPVTATVQALLAGPSDWLQPVVASAFPPGTQLLGQNLALDDSGKLRVRLGSQVNRIGPGHCQRMAAQLINTVQDQSTPRVDSVEIDRADGRTLCSLGHDDARPYAPSQVEGDADQLYFVDGDHRLESVGADSQEAHRVTGPFGSGQVGLRSVAVSRDEQTAAGVREDGRVLYVGPLSSGGAARAVLTSSAQQTSSDGSDGLTAPSWDGLGNLWVADRDAHGSRLLMWRNGRTAEVSVPNLADGRIQAVRVAADGVRIALLVNQGGHTQLELGRVEWSGTAADPQVSVTELRDAAPQFSDVDAMSWAGDSKLVVVGSQERGVQQLQYVDTDGSAAYTPTLPGISKVSAVAASENEAGGDRPLLVDSDEGMYRLPADTDWQQLSPDGTSPVYPG